MFMVEIRGMRCLYTGDYSRIPDRHMPAADLPMVPPNIVIVESTFGTSNHLPREDREKAFQSKVCNFYHFPVHNNCMSSTIQSLFGLLANCHVEQTGHKHRCIVATQKICTYRSIPLV
jgi:Cft2 family RNA processing exonuclease